MQELTYRYKDSVMKKFNKNDNFLVFILNMLESCSRAKVIGVGISNTSTTLKKTVKATIDSNEVTFTVTARGIQVERG